MVPSPLERIGGHRCAAHQSDAQVTLWETLLPPEVLRLPPGLMQIDALLDDPLFFEPFEEFFDPEIGRPSIPMETYLRMMFLRLRYRLGFETLCAEVADSWAWRRFCHIGLTNAVPHPTTLMKITTRCGAKVVAQLNEALLAKADGAKVVKLDKVRADTTVVEANVSYPSDAGLLAKGVDRLTKLVEKLKAAGYTSRTGFRDRTRSVRRRTHAIGAWLRRRSDEAKDEVLTITGELVAIARASVKEALVVGHNTRRSLAAQAVEASGRAKALVDDLEETVAILEQVIAQTKVRLSGSVPDGSKRVVSLHDTDARPIRKGRLGRPGGIRLQGPGTRQRRWRRARPRGHDRQPLRTAPARAGHRARHRVVRPHPEGCDRRSRLWRGQRGRRAL